MIYCILLFLPPWKRREDSWSMLKHVNPKCFSCKSEQFTAGGEYHCFDKRVINHPAMVHQKRFGPSTDRRLVCQWCWFGNSPASLCRCGAFRSWWRAVRRCVFSAILIERKLSFGFRVVNSGRLLLLVPTPLVGNMRDVTWCDISYNLYAYVCMNSLVFFVDLLWPVKYC